MRGPGSATKERLTEQVSKAVESAGTLVAVALAVALAALVVAGTALVVAVRVGRTVRQSAG